MIMAVATPARLPVPTRLAMDTYAAVVAARYKLAAHVAEKGELHAAESYGKPYCRRNQQWQQQPVAQTVAYNVKDILNHGSCGFDIQGKDLWL